MATLPAQSGQVWQRFLFHQKLSADSFLSDTLSVLWLFTSQTHRITGDATSQQAMVSYPTGWFGLFQIALKKGPKLSSPEGIRTRVRRAESRDLTICATAPSLDKFFVILI